MTIARPNAAFHAVGHALDRVDGPAKVTGSMGYTAGITLPGMLRARVLRSPLPHARIRSIDASRAEQIPGVLEDYSHTAMAFGEVLEPAGENIETLFDLAGNFLSRHDL